LEKRQEAGRMANTDLSLWKTCEKLVEKLGKSVEKFVEKHPNFSTKIFNNFFNISFNIFSTSFSTAENQQCQGKNKFSIKNQEVLFISRKYL
jgi:hypothetical protein